ncbi:MAG: transposase [Bacteroidales bacterium]|nr:transposase [Bacteroidales bacterium]
MPRKSREKSATGVYHVMLRGINKGNVFLEEMDCLKFLKILKSVTAPVDCEGKLLPPFCEIYAYCLMTNHIHLLIAEKSESISSVMKRISVAYVAYFNRHHERLGPLFQDRFRSECVGNQKYFMTLLRYIHQNPVEASIVDSIPQYRWSSWHEYSPAVAEDRICSKEWPFAPVPWEEMCEIVSDCNQKYECKSKINSSRMTDSMARTLFQSISSGVGLDDMTIDEKAEIVKKAIDAGIGKRQLARVSGMNLGSIVHFCKRKKGESPVTL